MRISDWRSDVCSSDLRRREEASLPPPNRCDDCSVREGCHQTFGEVEGIGLFPFTAASLDRLFAALNDRDSGMTWKTPRGVLQEIGRESWRERVCQDV